MSPEKMVNYIQNDVKFTTFTPQVSDIDETLYPLVAAVNRASKSKLFEILF